MHLQPASIEEELQQGEDRYINIQVMALVTLGRVEELTTNQASEKKRVDSQSDDLLRETETSLTLPRSLCGRFRAVIGLQ